MRIHKYTLALEDMQTLFLPEGAKLLTVNTQEGCPRLWALCDLEKPLEQRKIAIYGTGQDIGDKPGNYIGTFQLREGLLIFHCFELKVTI